MKSVYEAARTKTSRRVADGITEYIFRYPVIFLYGYAISESPAFGSGTRCYGSNQDICDTGGACPRAGGKRGAPGAAGYAGREHAHRGHHAGAPTLAAGDTGRYQGSVHGDGRPANKHGSGEQQHAHAHGISPRIKQIVMIKRTFVQLQTKNRRCAFLRFLNEDPTTA